MPDVSERQIECFNQNNKSRKACEIRDVSPPHPRDRRPFLGGPRIFDTVQPLRNTDVKNINKNKIKTGKNKREN